MKISKLIPLALAVAAIAIVTAPAGAATMAGTKGPDVLRGTGKADVIRGKAGDDTIRGRKGNDRLYGQKGADTLVGGPGSDRLFGGAGDDTIYAQDGTRDTVACGPGVDTVIADTTDTLAADCEQGSDPGPMGPDGPSDPGPGPSDPGPGPTDPGPGPDDPGVVPTPSSFPLDIHIVGSGTILLNNLGFFCFSDCSGEYESGTQISLAVGLLLREPFAGWGGACSVFGTQDVCVLTVNEAKSVTAYFGERTLTVAVFGPGGVSRDAVLPADGYCDATISPCEWSYLIGTTVTIQANAPGGGTSFLGWEGACSGTAPTCTLTLTEDTAVTARFGRRLPPDLGDLLAGL